MQQTFLSSCFGFRFIPEWALLERGPYLARVPYNIYDIITTLFKEENKTYYGTYFEVLRYWFINLTCTNIEFKESDSH